MDFRIVRKTDFGDLIRAKLKEKCYTVKVSCWDLETYIPYLKKRLEVLLEIDNQIKSKDEIDDFSWRRFQEEKIDIRQELHRAEIYLKHPENWCPTNPQTLFTF